MGTKPRLITTIEGDVAVVSFIDARILDESSVKAIGNELEDLITKRYLLKMILDFSKVSHLSSAVIGKIIAVYKKMKAEKGEIKLCGLNPVIREVFKVTQVDKMIEVQKDTGSALKSFQKKRWFGR